MVAWNCYFLILTACLFQLLYSHKDKLVKLDKSRDIASALKPLTDVCIDNILSANWWTYSICFGRHVRQIHYDLRNNRLVHLNNLGKYMEEESTPSHHIYREMSPTCVASPTEVKTRYTEVTIECCGGDQALMKASRQSYYSEDSDVKQSPRPSPDLYISKVLEPIPCNYYVYVCSELMCKKPNHKQKKTESKTVVASNSNTAIVTTKKIPSLDHQHKLKEKVRSMFNFAYTAYMENGFPEAELMPISCEGGKFDLIKIPLVTLIDTLDTLVVLGNYSEFRHAVDLVVTHLPTFNFDVNVSVFETTIRLVGGLLSAHLMAIDPALGIYTERRNDTYQYRGELLSLCIDLGERLLPAFNTKTGIPYGTVNLRYGVPTGETKIASTAGAGSLLVEFEVLSYLSGDPKFGEAAYTATEALYLRRSSIGLLGKHISTETGYWHEALSGVGSNADSFYEYLLKSYLLFRNEDLYQMFTDTYRAIKRFILVNEHWFTEVDMFSGKLHRKRVENLDAFWPGVEAMLGNSHHSAKQLNTFYAVWNDLGFLPEEFDYSQYQQGKGVTNAYYPLRPELIESTYHQYRTTGDRSWLIAGEQFLDSIETHTKTTCGYASVSNLNSLELENSMPSFFLSETLKYLYLLFDEDNFIHHRPYIFSTEAHPFDSSQLFSNDMRYKNSSTDPDFVATMDNLLEVKSLTESPVFDEAVLVEEIVSGVDSPLQQLPAVVVDETVNSKMVSQIRMLTEMLKNRLRASGENLKDLMQFLGKDESSDVSEIEVEAIAASGAATHIESEEPEQATVTSSVEDGVAIVVEEDDSAAVEMLEKTIMEAVKTIKPSAPSLLPVRCRKRLWWDRSNAYDSNYLNEANRQAREGPEAQFDLEEEVLSLDRQLVNSVEMVLEQLDQTEEAELLRKSASDTPLGRKAQVHKKRRRTRSHLASTHKRSNICLPDEAPKAVADANVLKNVDINMGDLGDFNIKVYADSFVVLNKDEKNTIEISNIGRSIVLVRDYDQKKIVSRSITANSNGLIGSCHVHARKGHLGGGSSTGSSGSSDVVYSRPCSAANFGPSHESLSMQGEFMVPSLGNGHVCKSTEEYLLATKKRWWQWSIPASGEGINDDETLQGKIVLANRGECLFEDKTLVAQKEGALGVIIRNNEDNVFVMAGKRDIEDAEKIAASSGQQVVVVNHEGRPVKSGKKDKGAQKGKKKSKKSANAATASAASVASKVPLVRRINPSKPSDAAEQPESHASEDSDDTESEEPKITIPTVMLSKTDADKLEQLMHLTNSANEPLLVDIDVSVHHMLLNTEFMGNFDYPKMWMRTNIIYIIGSGKWGTFLTSTSGEDWQLYLMSKKDMSASAVIPAITIMDEVDQPVSVTSNVLTNPVELYAYTISRKCPNVLKVAKDGSVRLKS